MACLSVMGVIMLRWRSGRLGLCFRVIRVNMRDGGIEGMEEMDDLLGILFCFYLELVWGLFEG